MVFLLCVRRKRVVAKGAVMPRSSRMFLTLEGVKSGLQPDGKMLILPPDVKRKLSGGSSPMSSAAGRAARKVRMQKWLSTLKEELDRQGKPELVGATK